MAADLPEQLKLLHASLSAEMRDRWDRDLPLGELLSDRWDRARTLGFGEGSSVYAESYVYGRPNVGRDVWIGPYTLLDGTGGLTIGDGSTISAGVQIYTHDTVLRTLSGGQSDVVRSSVTIGSRVYIGPNCVIARGVTIGDMSVVGTGSFVNRDVAPHTIAVGTPARPIGKVIIADDGQVDLKLDASPEV
jgi:acetyltransferase-like isoleucine patch superfamily enzyme